MAIVIVGWVLLFVMLVVSLLMFLILILKTIVSFKQVLQQRKNNSYQGQDLLELELDNDDEGFCGMCGVVTIPASDMCSDFPYCLPEDEYASYT